MYVYVLSTWLEIVVIVVPRSVKEERHNIYIFAQRWSRAFSSYRVKQVKDANFVNSIYISYLIKK